MSGTTAALYLLRRGDYTPQFDVARSVRAIVITGSLTALELAWLSISMDYEMSGRAIEPQIREAYETQKAMITDVYAVIEASTP